MAKMRSQDIGQQTDDPVCSALAGDHPGEPVGAEAPLRLGQ
jgi:hypothetical protein